MTDFSLEETAALRAHYDEQGYVVIRGLVPGAAIAAVRAAFERDLRPFRGVLYRQNAAVPGRHQFDEYGHLTNSLLNLQSLPRSLGGFISAALSVLTHQRVQTAVQALLDDRPKLVQSMFFEANAATQAHQDTYYLDAEHGGMTAGWFALEDIAAEAGRFYVCPGSHRIDVVKNGGDFDIAYNSDRYAALMRKIIADRGLELRAPALKSGDVLFWNARTIHGALPTQDKRCSRTSMTAHYIPDSARFLQFQSRIKPLVLDTVNGMRIHKPKDLNRARNKAVLWLETNLPGVFHTLRRAAIKTLTR